MKLLLHERFILKTFTSRFILILLSSIFLFSIFFTSTVGSAARKSNEANLILYVATEAAKYLQILIPFSFTLSLVLSSCNLNKHFELIGFQISGLSNKKIFQPIWYFCFFISSFLAFNNQFIVPKLEKKMSLIRIQAAKTKAASTCNINTISLPDNTIIAYSKYLNEQNEFIDVYWFKAPNFIWHLEKLKYLNGKMIAEEVDIFHNDSNQGYILLKHIKSLAIPEMPILTYQTRSKINSEIFSFSELLLHLVKSSKLTTQEYLKVESLFWKKVNFLFLCQILFLVYIPFLTRFARFRKTYKTIAVSIIVFLFFFSIIDSVATLNAHNLLSAPISCIGFNLLFGIPGIYYYLKS